MAGRPKKVNTEGAKKAPAVKAEKEAKEPEVEVEVKAEAPKKEVKKVEPKKEVKAEVPVEPKVEVKPKEEESRIPKACEGCSYKFDTSPCKSCVVFRKMKK